MKKKLLIAIAILTPIGAVVSDALTGEPFPVIAAGLLAMFLVYSLWDPPRKHKDFSYEDQRKGVASAYGGAGPPDLSNLVPPELRETNSEQE